MIGKRKTNRFQTRGSVTLIISLSILMTGSPSDNRLFAAVDPLDTLVTLDTRPHRQAPMRVSEMIAALKDAAGFQYMLTSDDIETKPARFQNAPVGEVLDTALGPLGLRWERNADGFIRIGENPLVRRSFRLTRGETDFFTALITNDMLEPVVFGEKTPPLEDTKIILDPRVDSLISEDRQSRVEKLAMFIDKIRKSPKPEKADTSNIRWAFEPVDDDDAQSGKLQFASLVMDAPAPRRNKEHGVFLVEDYLIVKAGANEIDRVETLLAQSVGAKTLDEMDAEQLRMFRQHLEGGLALTPQLASTRGNRKLYPSRAEVRDTKDFRITIVDNKDQINRVRDYLAAAGAIGYGPSGGPLGKHRAVDLKYQTTSEMISMLDAIYNRTPLTPSSSGDQGLEKRFTLSNPEKEFTWRDFSCRLISVRSNTQSSGSSSGGTNNSDQRSECELYVRTATSTGNNVQIREYETETVDDYELTVTKIRAGGGRAGGTVSLTVRYRALAVTP